MNERGPERNDRAHRGNGAAFRGMVLTAAAVGSMVASPVQMTNLNNANNPGSRDNVAIVSVHEARSQRRRNIFESSVVLPQEAREISSKIRAVAGYSADVISEEGSDYVGNRGHRGVTSRNNHQAKREKIGEKSSPLDSRLSLAEAVRAKLEKRNKNLSALSEHQLQALVDGAIKGVLRKSKFPLRKKETVSSEVGGATNALDQFNAEKLEAKISAMIKFEIDRVFAGKAEKRDRRLKAKREFLGSFELAGVDDEADHETAVSCEAGQVVPPEDIEDVEGEARELEYLAEIKGDVVRERLAMARYAKWAKSQMDPATWEKFKAERLSKRVLARKNRRLMSPQAEA